MLLLHKADGTVKARCVECEKLVDVPPSSSGYAICSPCLKAKVVGAIVRDGGKVPKWA